MNILGQAIGIALLHFTWQALLIGAFVGVGLLFMRGASANARYLLCLAGMLLLIVAPLLTVSVTLSGDTAALEHSAGASVGFHKVGPPNWLVPLLPWLTVIWISGVTLFQARFLVNWVRAEHLRRVGVRLPMGDLQRHVDDLRRKLLIPKAVRVAESLRVQVPALVGWLKPVILVPTGIMMRLTPEQLRAILAHELAHVRRHDYLVNLTQSVFESLFFFHPVTWWISNRLRVEREYCCDDIALSVSHSAFTYAKALSALDELHANQPQTVLAAHGRKGGPLMKRILRILESDRSSGGSRGRWLSPFLTLAGVLALVAVAGFGFAEAGDSDKTDVPEAAPVAPAPVADVPDSAPAPAAMPAADSMPSPSEAPSPAAAPEAALVPTISVFPAPAEAPEVGEVPDVRVSPAKPCCTKPVVAAVPASSSYASYSAYASDAEPPEDCEVRCITLSDATIDPVGKTVSGQDCKIVCNEIGAGECEVIVTTGGVADCVEACEGEAECVIICPVGDEEECAESCKGMVTCLVSI